MVTLYVNPDIPSQYKYITNVTNYSFDLYDRSNTSNSSGNYYRIYYGLDEDFYTINSYNNTIYGGTTTTEIIRTDDFLARQDSHIILFNGLSIIVLITLLLNIFTSIIKKGGVLHA